MGMSVGAGDAAAFVGKAFMIGAAPDRVTVGRAPAEDVSFADTDASIDPERRPQRPAPQRDTSADWLPPALRPFAQSGGANSMNVPYWLQMVPEGTIKGDWRKNAARMVDNEIQQYVPTNGATYSRNTLREIQAALQPQARRSAAVPQQRSPQALAAAWRRAEAAMRIINDDQPAADVDSVA